MLRPELHVLVFCLVFNSCGGQKYEEQGLEFRNWYVVKPIADGGGTVAYGQVRNASNMQKNLRQADFSCAATTALHETVISADRVTMKALPEIAIAPGETVSFEPGHKHIMLTQTKAGDSICAAAFTFGNTTIKFAVRVMPRK